MDKLGREDKDKTYRVKWHWTKLGIPL